MNDDANDARSGNLRRVKRWRARFPEKYRLYQKMLMRKRRVAK